MKTASQLISRTQPGSVSEIVSVQRFEKPPSERHETIGDIEKEVVNYVFAKVQITWGDALYHAHVGDEDTLRIIKRDWAHDILQALNIRRGASESDTEYMFRVKSRIDKIFQELRHLLSDQKTRWEFPSLRNICAYMANHRPQAAHREFRPDRLLPDKAAQDRARKAGAEQLAVLRSMFGQTEAGAR